MFCETHLLNPIIVVAGCLVSKGDHLSLSIVRYMVQHNKYNDNIIRCALCGD